MMLLWAIMYLGCPPLTFRKVLAGSNPQILIKDILEEGRITHVRRYYYAQD